MSHFKVKHWRVIEQIWVVEAENEEQAEELWDSAGEVISETSDPDDGQTFAGQARSISRCDRPKRCHVCGDACENALPADVPEKCFMCSDS